jgi:hypothetical protein
MDTNLSSFLDNMKIPIVKHYCRCKKEQYTVRTGCAVEQPANVSATFFLKRTEENVVISRKQQESLKMLYHVLKFSRFTWTII